jgi:hypothetical protein
VTLLAVLSFISVGTYLVLMVLALAAPEALRGVLEGISPQGSGPVLLMQMGRGLAVYFLVMALLGGLFAYGMWTLRNWARWVTIIITAISLVAIVAGLIGLGFGIDPSALLLGLLRVGLCTLVLWYLWRPRVRAAFRSRAIKEAQ